jgi:hypothetical protein
VKNLVGEPAFKFHLKILQDTGRVMLAILEEYAAIKDTHATALGLNPVTDFVIICALTFSALAVVDWRITGSRYRRYN